ncbi:MAG: hypothetical protein J6S62_03890 [Bacteroidales bacterium]|nr:hypothetical protein [Bacteroidales bacterium]
MKKFIPFALCALALTLAFSCTPDIFDPSDPYGRNDNTPPILDGNTLTYGEHTYELKLSEKEGTVTFTHFPSNVREFKALQNQLLGKCKPGVLALELMAMEMYRRNRTAGLAAMELCNVSTNVKSILNVLPQKFPEKRGFAPDDSYQQPYLIATFLKGATPENKYQPDYPYEMTFYENPSEYVKQGEYSYSWFGRVYEWCIMRYGEKETSASVVLIDDEELYLVTNCAGYYVGVPPVKTWEDTLL